MLSLFSALSATTTPVPVSQILTQAGDVVSNMLSWVVDVGNAIVNNGILFLTVGIFILGAVIAVFSRLLRRG